MSFALLILGIILVWSAVRNTQACLVSLVQSDFSGPGNYTYWVAAILIIGAIGYSENLRALSTGLLVLILLALLLTRGKQGLFKNLTDALKGTKTASVGGGGGAGVTIDFPGAVSF